MPRNRKSPDLRPKLRVGNAAEDNGMHGKHKVINPHRWILGFRMASGILAPNNGGVEERASVYCVAGESEDVDGWEVDCLSGC